MKKLARVLFNLIAVISILIGALHTFVHFQDLVTPELQEMMNHFVPVAGQDASVWKLWQGMSLMMGYMFILFGLTNLFIGLSLDKEECPPIPAILLMMCYLGGSIYLGFYYFEAAQVYGGIFGLVVLSISLFITLGSRQKIIYPF